MNHDLDQQLAREIADVILSSREVSRSLNLPAWMERLLSFTETNLRRMSQEEGSWDKTRLKDEYQMARLTDRVTELIGMAHRLGRTVNRYRKVVGLRPLDFYQAAIDWDRREHVEDQSDGHPG